jgi:hypothetical protein
MLLFSIYGELTDVVCVSEVGFCAIADLNVLELMGRVGVGLNLAVGDLPSRRQSTVRNNLIGARRRELHGLEPLPIVECSRSKKVGQCSDSKTHTNRG